jgi:hypothetical protein
MREYITNNDERINLKQLEDIMKIKEQIKTIIEDYSEARDISAEYNKYDGFFKGHQSPETVWNFVKHPFLLRVKGLLASLKLIKISN